MTSAIGRNYARALFDLAQETGSLDAIEEDLRAARQALHDDTAVRDFLGNRLIGRPAKKAAVRAGLEGAVDERVMTLLFIMVDRGRTRLLGEVSEELERLARLARGVRKVDAASAFPLGAGERSRLVEALEARYGGRVDLEAAVRPSLIGGVVAASEGQEIALSLEGELKRLRESLMGKEVL